MEATISRCFVQMPPPTFRARPCFFRKFGSRLKIVVSAAANNPETFLSPEEAGLIEMSGLSVHERFLARLTVSSLNLLKVISKQEGKPIEDLNAGSICDWFIKDKGKRDSATLKWGDDSTDSLSDF